MAMPWEWCCAIVLEFLFILFSGLGYCVSAPICLFIFNSQMGGFS